jgi:hypothetical protein
MAVFGKIRLQRRRLHAKAVLSGLAQRQPVNGKPHLAFSFMKDV